jgi:hypothetical protein
MFTDLSDAPVNLAQWGLLFEDEHLGRGRLYRIGWATRLTGHLDPAALRAALNRVVRRHEALRTALVTVDGEWRQRLTGAVTFPLEQRALDERTAVPEALAEFFGRPFELSRPPLARGLLLRTGDAEHVLAFGLHHAICDRWSLRIILADLAYAYPGRALPPSPPSFLAICAQRATPAAVVELDEEHRHWVRLLESRAARRRHRTAERGTRLPYGGVAPRPDAGPNGHPDGAGAPPRRLAARGAAGRVRRPAASPRRRVSGGDRRSAGRADRARRGARRRDAGADRAAAVRGRGRQAAVVDDPARP